LVEPHLSTMPHSKVLGVKLDPLINGDQWPKCTAPLQGEEPAIGGNECNNVLAI